MPPLHKGALSPVRQPFSTVYVPSASGGGSPSADPSASGGPGSSGGLVSTWPDCGSRDISPSADMAAANTTYRFGVNGPAWVAILDARFAGDVEVSENGNGPWFPVVGGAVWPSTKSTTRKGGGHRFCIFLRRRSAGGGKLVVAQYSSLARAGASKVGGQGPAQGAPSVTNTGVIVQVIATGAAAQVTLNSATVSMVLKADEDNSAAVFVAETSAKATTAAGWELYQGSELEWWGALFSFSVAAQTLRVLERTV